MSAKAPRWERVRTDAGWHLRLLGGNGEPILTSEVYEDPRTAQQALVTAAASLAFGSDVRSFTEVDERSGG